jgi:DsbC/DsbD-like thiol-disulfide interchange protein
VPVLKDFAARRKISFPLLSDPDSTVIRRFGVLSPDYPEGDVAHGVPHPVTFITDEHAVVRSKFSEGSYVNRRTAASILVVEGGGPAGGQAVKAERLAVRSALSNDEAFPGNLVSLTVDVELENGVHAYAPGAKGYRPLELRLEPQPLLSFGETVYPPSHPYVFRPLKETVPVFEGSVRLARDVTIAGGKETAELLRSPDPTLTIRGSLAYQVCSDRVCYPPREVPLTWTIKVRPLERERPPENLRRKPTR